MTNPHRTLNAGVVLTSVTVNGTMHPARLVQVATGTASAITPNTSPYNLLATATSLTINGVGFSGTKSLDTVKFTGNGTVTGTITNTTPTALIVSVTGLVAGNYLRPSPSAA